jgi:hypothetical protein
MTDNPNVENPLDRAGAQLRDICEQHGQLGESLDTGSLSRMIAHIENINRAVCTSTRDHANAAKRLTDFAVTLDRIARHSPPTAEELAQRLESVAHSLKATGAELAGANELPKWAPPPAD